MHYPGRRHNPRKNKIRPRDSAKNPLSKNLNPRGKRGGREEKIKKGTARPSKQVTKGPRDFEKNMGIWTARVISNLNRRY